RGRGGPRRRPGPQSARACATAERAAVAATDGATRVGARLLRGHLTQAVPQTGGARAVRLVRRARRRVVRAVRSTPELSDQRTPGTTTVVVTQPSSMARLAAGSLVTASQVLSHKSKRVGFWLSLKYQPPASVQSPSVLTRARSMAPLDSVTSTDASSGFAPVPVGT